MPHAVDESSHIDISRAAATGMETVQVGRQPILDRDQKVYGYELLYRDANARPGEPFCGDKATSRTLLNTCMEIGLENIVGRHRIFVNLTKPFITDLPPIPLDRERLVLEVLEDIEVDQALIDGVRALQRAGYQVALDDYRFESRWDPLLPYASIIKVDIMGLDLEPHTGQIEALKERGLILLAEKVETREEFKLTRELGFDLFQGYFFAKPHIVSGRRLAENQAVMLRLLGQINDPDCTIDDLGRLISQDPQLSFKILRYVNSAGVGLPRQVDSIRQAVVYVGMDRIRTWTTLIAMAGHNNKSPELMNTGLLRATLCEALCTLLEEGRPECAYTVGLLSVLDALIDQPMATLLKQLPLPPLIADALLRDTGPYAGALQCSKALEVGDWQNPAMQLLPLPELNGLYMDAVAHAEQAQDALL